jgi:hypothetical protein
VQCHGCLLLQGANGYVLQFSRPRHPASPGDRGPDEDGSFALTLFQWTETGIYLAAALALAGYCFRRLRRRLS